MTTTKVNKRGFATLSPDRMREIASQGGKAAHAKGTGHEFTHEEAVSAGRKGGLVAAQRRRERLAASQITHN